MKRKLVSLCLATTLIMISSIPTYAKTTSNEKEEVVYIMTDATGAVDSVNVVNIFHGGEITDYGNYSKIQMLNTTDEMTQKEDTITFATDADKVYYQGTMEQAEIPWNISIQYFLNHQEVTPEALAGQSGQLEIKIHISENKNCNYNYYENYALMMNLLLDTENCTSIQGEDATMANVGTNKQLSYTILPGKGLETTITADVTDFEMPAIEINGVQLNLDVEIDDEELMEKVTDIMSATKELNDGTSELTKGANELKDGAIKLQNGLDTLNANSENLTNGSSEIEGALNTVKTSLEGIVLSTDALQEIAANSVTLSQGIGDLYNGAVKLESNISVDAYKQAMLENGVDINGVYTSNTNTIDALNAQISQLPPESELAIALSNTVNLLMANNAVIDGTAAYLETASAGAGDLTKGLETLNNNYGTFDQVIQTLVSTLSDLATNMATLKTGVNTLVENYGALDEGITKYTDSVALVVENYESIVAGTEAISKGSQELAVGTNEFYGKTTDMDVQVTDNIDDMIAALSGNKENPVSFTSDKNANVKSVQFVMKTGEIKVEPSEKEETKQPEKKNFIEKLISLFDIGR